MSVLAIDRKVSTAEFTIFNNDELRLVRTTAKKKVRERYKTMEED